MWGRGKKREMRQSEREGEMRDCDCDRKNGGEDDGDDEGEDDGEDKGESKRDGSDKKMIMRGKRRKRMRQKNQVTLRIFVLLCFQYIFSSFFCNEFYLWWILDATQFFPM